MKRSVQRLFALALAPLAACSPAWGQSVVRASVGAGGAQANGMSDEASLSRDGRFVAFTSGATNLVPGDTNGRDDIFVRDLQSGATTRVSVGAGGVQGTRDSRTPAISGTGRYVAFVSEAPEFAAGDTGTTPDVFVHDRQTGVTTLVSRTVGNAPTGGSSDPSISDSGRRIAFVSTSDELIFGDSNFAADVFVHDLDAGTITRVSVSSGGGQVNGASAEPSIAPDGQWLAFSSVAANVVFGDGNGVRDVFLHYIPTSATIRVSVGPGGLEADGASFRPSVSDGAGTIAFDSSAANLVVGDTNGALDVFTHNPTSGVTTRLSVGPGGSQAAEESMAPAVSADGRFVAFTSLANTLVAGDSDFVRDVFVRDLQTGQTTRVSVGPGGAPANFASDRPSISEDGERIAFESAAGNLVPNDTNLIVDVFVSGVSGGPGGCAQDLSGDGLVNSVDLGQLLGAWGPGSGVADINNDGLVDSRDLAFLLGAWGACP